MAGSRQQLDKISINDTDTADVLHYLDDAWTNWQPRQCTSCVLYQLNALKLAVGGAIEN